MMLPATATRVQAHTSERVQQRIERATLRNLDRAAGSGSEAIDQRLRELDAE